MLKPKDLGISIKERNALVKVRDGLQAGEYVHVKEPIYRYVPCKKPIFNMVEFEGEFDCGTVRCIGGWVAHLCDNFSPRSYVCNAEGPLGELYFPLGGDGGNDDYAYSRITPKQAAKAITNFLDTGKPEWRKVLRIKQAA
ncbi:MULTISPECIES: hypothetical protein [unclassified Beijerinckia]|uniref:hypothetical protein n=1 Tax=unclassified Beijerinckia TaxID=2638183 RepID=UPI0008989234|nr:MULTISPECIES: hypothetical protein [unclassified Beijerinckia]MDH7796373.1 hypothetical protein [Beijerinckia sp. GAS462]SEC42334.1 hypothetical protein SAMN05443249_2656 [Beijerinckia sp. 28-YEA-48]